MPEASVAYTIRSNVRAGELQKIKQMFKEGVDIEAVMEPSDTLRKWTPLHIAAWGTAKPQYDRDIIEQLLLAANKAGKDAPIRGAKCGVDGETPLDLAKQRLAKHDANPPKAGADDKDYLDDKRLPRVAHVVLGCGRKLDKIVEWLEKGLPTG